MTLGSCLGHLGIIWGSLWDNFKTFAGHFWMTLGPMWDYVGDDLHDYKLGKSVYIGENKIFFIGGRTGTFSADEDDLVKTCSMVTF